MPKKSNKNVSSFSGKNNISRVNNRMSCSTLDSNDDKKSEKLAMINNSKPWVNFNPLLKNNSSSNTAAESNKTNSFDFSIIEQIKKIDKDTSKSEQLAIINNRKSLVNSANIHSTDLDVKTITFENGEVVTIETVHQSDKDNKEDITKAVNTSETVHQSDKDSKEDITKTVNTSETIHQSDKDSKEDITKTVNTSEQINQNNFNDVEPCFTKEEAQESDNFNKQDSSSKPSFFAKVKLFFIDIFNSIQQICNTMILGIYMFISRVFNMDNRESCDNHNQFIVEPEIPTNMEASTYNINENYSPAMTTRADMFIEQGIKNNILSSDSDTNRDYKSDNKNRDTPKISFS